MERNNNPKSSHFFKLTVLSLATLSSFSYAQLLQEQVYNDSSASMLERADSQDIELDKAKWMSPVLNNYDKGLVFRDQDNSNESVLSAANLVVDYTANTDPQFVIGGYSNDADIVTDNKVTLIHAQGVGDVYGGVSHYSQETADAVNSTNNTNTSIAINSKNPAANGNSVIINDNAGTINGSVTGGSAVLWTKTGSAITYDYSNAYAIAYTSANDAQVNANNNVITIGNDINSITNITGGYASIELTTGTANATATATNNAHTLALGSANTSASADNAQINANNNNITIGNNIDSIGNITGGYANLALTTDTATTNATTTATANPAATASTNTNTYARAYKSQINANNNVVTIGNGNNSIGNITGGYANLVLTSADANSSAASNNASNDNIYTQTSSYPYGSQINANHNEVIIGNGNNSIGNITGGDANLALKAGNTSMYSNGSNSTNASTTASRVNVLADNNKVTFDGNLTSSNTAIYGGRIGFNIITGEVYENGSLKEKGDFFNQNSIASATNNTITIGENAHFSNDQTQSLYGGYLELNTTTALAPITYNVFTGNTLNYAAKTPASFKTVGNFENYNFTLTPELANSTTPLIFAQDIVLGTDTSNTNDTSLAEIKSNVNVVGIHSGNILKVDDSFVLMQSSNAFTGTRATGQTMSNISQAQQGISLLYDVRTDIDTTNNKVTATIVGATGSPVRVNPQLKALSEGYLANTMLVTRGADMMAYETISVISSQNQNSGLAPFVTSSIQYNRYNSGSHIKSDDYLLSGGLSYQQDNITAAAIIEGGWGSYDSYNSFSNTANVHGDGNTSYYGFGVLGKYELNNGLYTDGSLRYGRTQIKFDTNDIVNLATGQNARYKLNTNYASTHIGVGYNLSINEKNTLDLSTKYLYTTVQGKNVNVAGDNIHFDRVNSSRVRLNVEISHQYSRTVTLHVNTGYEYEYDGKVKATTYGVYKIDEPKVKGGTGIISLGLSVKPSQESKFTFIGKVKGYAGKREGGGLDLMVNYSF
ncbi:autotransporter outer membrane beta-barrel domain-containing protein [Entomomonas moraniae]|uniref:Autotransporter outer membrane beta-barrel domain-containing protein n=1 Tax=Entomomonas moraniae TaxID=2213226 RepID=A0A3Q9JLK5_9GAMM|nr:autotransporter outer membrane beta-barrel domain-containing protein [Entomomonas moraniae]AZS50549.1 autotransporter outer membrane beta-barrel domain-containing protein [Entomomonas moraniae]